MGVRFLYPVYFIPEVELLTTKFTALEALEKVRSFLEKMNKVAFFRSGNEPIVLSEEQRDARRNGNFPFFFIFLFLLNLFDFSICLLYES